MPLLAFVSARIALAVKTASRETYTISTPLVWMQSFSRVMTFVLLLYCSFYLLFPAIYLRLAVLGRALSSRGPAAWWFLASPHPAPDLQQNEGTALTWPLLFSSVMSMVFVPYDHSIKTWVNYYNCHKTLRCNWLSRSLKLPPMPTGYICLRTGESCPSPCPAMDIKGPDVPSSHINRILSHTVSCPM